MRNYRLFYLLILAVFGNTNLFAQKLGYIDSDAILSQMKSYQKSQTVLQEQIKKWEKQVNLKFKKVVQMKENFNKEEILLTEELRREKLATIKKNEEEARSLQESIFGYQGMMFQRQEELIKPVREELYKAVQTVARRNGIQMMFDKSSSEYSLIFVEPRHDYTIPVLAELGITDKEGNPIKKEGN